MSKKELRVVKDYWQTPDWLFQNLNSRYDFNIDCAASASNAKCENYLNESDDYLNYHRLTQNHRCFINPPYSQVDLFIKRARGNWYKNGVSSLSLLPVRADQAWFHQVISDVKHSWPNCNVEYYLGRLHFDNPQGSTERKGGGFFYSINVVYGFLEVEKQISIDIRDPKKHPNSIRKLSKEAL